MKNYLQKRNYSVDPLFDAFDDFFKPMFYDDRLDSMRTDIKEVDGGYQLDIEMPGFEKNDIQISLQNGYLTVSAQKSEKEEGKGKTEKFIRKERSVSCQRSYYVGDDVDKDNVKAKYSNGMLTLTVPNSETKKLPSHNIEIE